MYISLYAYFLVRVHPPSHLLWHLCSCRMVLIMACEFLNIIRGMSVFLLTWKGLHVVVLTHKWTNERPFCTRTHTTNIQQQHEMQTKKGGRGKTRRWEVHLDRNEWIGEGRMGQGDWRTDGWLRGKTGGKGYVCLCMCVVLVAQTAK
jgi:hypothetical protein